MRPKIIMTGEEKPVSAPIEYTFDNGDGDVRIIEAQTYSKARSRLNRLTGFKTGYRLIQRKI
jgi:hypothetical protein